MDLVELREQIESLLADIAPNFDIGFTESGEIIIATGLCEDEDGEVVEMNEEEMDEDLLTDDESLDALEEEEMENE